MSRKTVKRKQRPSQPPSRAKGWIAGAVVIFAGLVLLRLLTRPDSSPSPDSVGSPGTRGSAASGNANDRSVFLGQVTFWWDGAPDWVRKTSFPTGDYSNVRPTDYSGPDACKGCHAEIYAKWTGHAHSRMNMVASPANVLGDFSGQSHIQYLGGRGDFYQQDGRYRMRLERDDVRRTYDVQQTIGSRFYQYYIGTLLEGPEPPEHEFYRVPHVLPFGYWLDRQEWVPVVHVHFAGVGGRERDEEILPDGQRIDPFKAKDLAFAPYAQGCSNCHTTWPIGDLLIRNTKVLGQHAPRPIDVSLPDYLKETHPELWPAEPLDMNSFQALVETLRNREAVDHAVSLGISCEACHLGARAHAEEKESRPRFYPASPHLFTQAKKGEMQLNFGRQHDNVNWACGRCHTGSRHQFAAGMGVWNSIEYTDAMRGSCYSALTCIHCHNPHETIGRQWKPTEDQDDNSCLACHEKYRAAPAREAHTHHVAGSSGARCLNCHMPRINEGLQDVVRTHMIYSPTRRDMIEANHPNACNLCHVDRPIDWTLTYLRQWYGATYDERQLTASYPSRDQPVTIGWLRHDDKSVRLVASDALARGKATWATPYLIDALDDAYLLNRQFAQIALEKMLGVDVRQYGYRHYLSPDERRDPLERIRTALPR
jgi:hypothetical protein